LAQVIVELISGLLGVVFSIPIFVSGSDGVFVLSALVRAVRPGAVCFR